MTAWRDDSNEEHPQLGFGFAPSVRKHDSPSPSEESRGAKKVVQAGASFEARQAARRKASQTFLAELEAQRKRLAHELSLHLQEPVAVMWHTNRHSMLSVKRLRLGYQFRMHVIFSAGAPHLVQAIARLARHNDRQASVVIDRFILEHADAIAHSATPREVETAGSCFDLQELFDTLNGRFFDGKVRARITWGRGSQKRRRSIKLGSYHASERLIRIHPALDQAFVPRYFIDFVIFHEMLHEQLGVTEQGSRRCVHPPEFRALEARFPHAKEAWAWEKANIGKLLRF